MFNIQSELLRSRLWSRNSLQFSSSPWDGKDPSEIELSCNPSLCYNFKGQFKDWVHKIEKWGLTVWNIVEIHYRSRLIQTEGREQFIPNIFALFGHIVEYEDAVPIIERTNMVCVGALKGGCHMRIEICSCTQIELPIIKIMRPPLQIDSYRYESLTWYNVNSQVCKAIRTAGRFLSTEIKTWP